MASEHTTQHDSAVQSSGDGPTDEPIERVEVLVVRVGGDRYAVEVAHAGRVVAVATAQSVPNTPPAVLGVGRIEGSVTALIDAATVLAGGSHDRDGDPAGEYLVADRGEDRQAAAIRIDGVEGIDTHPLAAVEPPGAAGGDESLLRGVIGAETEAEAETERLPVLDLEALLATATEGIGTGQLGSQPE